MTVKERRLAPAGTEDATGDQQDAAQQGAHQDGVHVGMDDRISLQALIDWVPDYLWVKDTEGRFVVVNQAIADDHGLANTADLIGKTDFDLHAPDMAQAFRDNEVQVLATERPMVDQEESIIDIAGRRKWLSTTKVPLRNEAGEVFGIVCVGRDISERKLADALRDGHARVLELVASNAPLDASLYCLLQLIRSQLPTVLCAIEVFDAGGASHLYGQMDALPPAYAQALTGGNIQLPVGGIASVDIAENPLWDGHRTLASLRGMGSCWVAPISSSKGTVLGALVLYSPSAEKPCADEARLIQTAASLASIAIERRQTEDRILFMATHDALTNLPNRAVLKERVAEAVQHAEQSGQRATVIFLDLDNFKQVNDSLGHQAGDELLKAVAVRMKHCVRPVDTVLRLGGDEFVVILSDHPDDDQFAGGIALRLKAAISEPLQTAGSVLRPTASIGVASYPADGADAETLLVDADTAMYRAKAMGRDNIQFFAR